jgi:hypothetical protein
MKESSGKISMMREYYIIGMETNNMKASLRMESTITLILSRALIKSARELFYIMKMEIDNMKETS